MLRSFSTVTLIITSIATFEAGMQVRITLRAFAEAAFMPVMDMWRRADMLLMVSAAVERFMAAGSREAAGSMVAADSMVAAVVGLEVEGTEDTKDGGSFRSRAEWWRSGTRKRPAFFAIC
jgi:hypothetical protein